MCIHDYFEKNKFLRISQLILPSHRLNKSINHYTYTQSVLQGTAYKGQLWQLVEFGKKLRDRLIFFPKIKGQDTMYQGMKG